MKSSTSITQQQTPSGKGRKAGNQLSVKKGMKVHRLIILTMANGYHKGKLGFKRKAADAAFYFNAKAIADALRENVSGYYTGFQHLTLLYKRIHLYGKSVESVKQGGLGKVGKKDTCKLELMKALNLVLDFVNGLARNDEANSEEIISGAKLQLCHVRSSNKQSLRVKQGASADELLLYCIALKIDGKYVRALYEWQYSIDNGKTWKKDIRSSRQANIKVTGMQKGIYTLFRFRSSTTKNVYSAWCNPVGIIPQ